MPSFSATSESRLQTLDPRLQAVLREGIEVIDFTILCGYRSQREQEEAFRLGHSTKPWPDSKHNVFPSIAVDIAPWFGPQVRIDWKDLPAFAYLAGYLQRIAHSHDVELRWGGDWNQNGRTVGYDPAEHFMDAGHLELVV